MMTLLDKFREIFKIQKFGRFVGYTTFYCFTVLVTYAYTNNTTRAGYSGGVQFYAAYPAGKELLVDNTKLYKAPYAYHMPNCVRGTVVDNIWSISSLLGSLTVPARSPTGLISSLRKAFDCISVWTSVMHT